MTSGLDIMKAASEKAKKRPQVGNEMPPPLHPARTTPVTLPEPPSADAPPLATASDNPDAMAGAGVAPATAPLPPPPAAQRPTPPRKQDKSPAQRTTSSELIATTAYLELDEDRYIRRTIDAGRYGKPKVTSASAVIRYAMQYLAQHMTPEEVVAAIREAAPETTNQGRIRL